MEILGFGKPKGHSYKHNVGDKLQYDGESKTLQKKFAKKQLVVRSRMIENKQNVYCCSLEGSKEVVACFTEGVVKKAKGLGSAVVVTPVPTTTGIGKLKINKTIQDVDKLAKSIQQKSGVKEKVTLNYYNISRSKAKEMAWKQLSEKPKKK